MKTPQIPAIPGMTALGLNPIASDQKTVAERRWRAPSKPAKAQQPCDIGLFSDEADQTDLIEMLQQPVEE